MEFREICRDDLSCCWKLIFRAWSMAFLALKKWTHFGANVNRGQRPYGYVTVFSARCNI